MPLGSQPAWKSFPANYSEYIPDGDAGVAATIGKMTTLLHSPQGIRSLTVRAAVADAVRGVDRGMPEIDAVFYWIKDNIEFRGEWGETLQSPEATINLQIGDCDDQSTLAAAMLNSLGCETRFKTIATRDMPEDLTHVYVEVRDKRTGEWMPLDPTVSMAYPGWEPENIARSETYGAIPAGSSDGGLALLAGLAFALLM
jgi:transglutaminase-like putative cysteine protease